MNAMGAGLSRRRRWLLWSGGGLLAILTLAAGVAAVMAHRLEPMLRARIVEDLQRHFHSRVELDSFHISVADGLWAEGKGLRIWPPAQGQGASVPAPSGEPLIRLQSFRFHAPLRYSPGKPVELERVELKGLDVHLPPRTHFGHATETGVAPPSATSGLLRLRLDAIECTGASLTLETDKPGKLPWQFAIARMKLTGMGAGGSMSFQAELTNPLPQGAIHTQGVIGPWMVADLGESPISGDYRFDHADLGGFKEIAGFLESAGHFQGTLRDLVADGETDTPDFRLRPFNHPMPLHTRFHARIDATNGDTWLEPVEATLGRSHFTAQGQIVRVLLSEGGTKPHSIGHDIALKINVDKGRIEDFLRLASHSGAPLLTGTVTTRATLHIPPGTDPAQQRMQLTGSFTLDDAQFTSAKIQDKIQEFSLRGQGRPKEAKNAAAVRSTMQGEYKMAAGVITLPALVYTVPGAVIQMSGAYAVEGGALDFAGTARTEATVSEMVGGWKGMLLKPADRLFRKDGAGTEIPIRIQGTREAPEFGIDFDRLKITLKQKPDREP